MKNATKVKNIIYVTLCLSFVFFISGCVKKDMSDLDLFIQEVQLKHTGKVEALPAIIPYESYTYQTYNKRNPFRPSASLVQTVTTNTDTSGLKPNTLRNKEDLEKYELASLIMVGIMNKNGQNWAIIKTPDSNIFRVKKGNYIGTNNGKILRITDSSIQLKEILKNGRGGWVEKKNTLAISE